MKGELELVCIGTCMYSYVAKVYSVFLAKRTILLLLVYMFILYQSVSGVVCTILYMLKGKS